MAEYLFVYGTLLKGKSNNSRLKDSTLVEYASVPGKLYDTDMVYPAAYYSSELESRIYCEIYKLPENYEKLLENLDYYEDIPSNIYIRDEILLNNKKAFIYTLRDRNSAKELKEINSGSWLKHNKSIRNNPLTFAKNFENAHKNYF